jgi:hypothetical protein
LQGFDAGTTARARYRLKTIAAREIKRRGISTVDEALKDGPVHVITNDR